MDTVYTVTVEYLIGSSRYRGSSTLECVSHSREAAESRIRRHYVDHYPSLRVTSVTVEYTRDQ